VARAGKRAYLPRRYDLIAPQGVTRDFPQGGVQWGRAMPVGRGPGTASGKIWQHKDEGVPSWT
jgi:hypothetical protein